MSLPLQALCEAVRALAQGGPVPHILEAILDQALAVTQADRGFVIMVKLKGADYSLTYKCARSRDSEKPPNPEQGVSRSTIEQVAATGQMILSYDAPKDPTMDLRKSVRVLGLRSLICAPLLRGDSVVGLLYLDSTELGIFRETDLPTIQALADVAAVAVELDELRPAAGPAAPAPARKARKPVLPPRVIAPPKAT